MDRQWHGERTAAVLAPIREVQRAGRGAINIPMYGYYYYFPYVVKVVTQTLGQPLQPQVGRRGGGWPVMFSGRCRKGQKVGCMCPGMGSVGQN